MKKVFLIGMLFAATVCNAQTVIFDGANYNENDDGGFLYNRADAKIVTEDGRKCLRMVTKEKTGEWAHEHYNVLRNISGVNFNGLRRVSFKMKMSKGHNVLLKITSASGTARRWFYYNGDETHKDTWQTMVFEFGLGTDAEKILNSNTEMEIWPFEDGDEAFNYKGETVFIDDIHVDGPVLKDNAAIRTLGNNSLTSKQVEITGSLSKGTYQCTWDGDWHNVAFDDYETLTSKISADVCFLNLTGAAVADGDGPQLRSKNPNLLILSPTAFYATDNVIRWDGEKNNTPKMVLTDAYPFYTSIDFHADAVEVTRNLKAGINSLCLPFYVGQAEISTNCKIATYKNGTTFTFVDHADANVPFLATAVDADAEKLNFTDKTVATPNSLGAGFVGVYVPLGAGEVTGKWGINADGKLQMGGALATISAFHAYLAEVPVSAREITIDDGEVTGIVNVNSLVPAEECVAFDLQGRQVAQPTRGLYIVNGKKIVVK